MKKTVSIILIFAICASFCSFAFADERTIQPRFSDIGAFFCNITKNILTYTVSCKIIAKDPSNTVSATVTLQEYTSSWTDTSHVWNISETAVALLEKNIFLGSGTYRIKMDITVLSPAGAVLEAETVYSNQYIL